MLLFYTRLYNKFFLIWFYIKIRFRQWIWTKKRAATKEMEKEMETNKAEKHIKKQEEEDKKRQEENMR